MHRISGLADYDNPGNNIITGISWPLNNMSAHSHGNAAHCYESTYSCHKLFSGASSSHYSMSILASASQLAIYPNDPNGRTISYQKTEG